MWIEHGDRVWSRNYESLDLNVGLIATDDGLVVIDTRATYAQARELRSHIAEVSSDRVRWVINTHHHWDHVFGNGEFHPEAFWGHERCADRLRDDGEKQRAAVKEWAPSQTRALDEISIVPPDHTFGGEITVGFGGRVVTLSHLGRGHTDNDIVVIPHDAEVVFAGDLVEQGAPPAFQDGYPLEWPETTARLLDLVTGSVVPGHGSVVDKAFVATQHEELAAVARLAAERHASGASPTDAADMGGPYDTATLEVAFTRAWGAL